MERKYYRTAEVKNITWDKITKIVLDVDRDLYASKGSKEEIITLPYEEAEKLDIHSGDLVKFEEDSLKSIIRIPSDNMDYTEYEALYQRIFKMSCKKLIETHKCLKGKIDSGIHDNLNYYEYYMNRVLDFNHGYSIIKEKTKELDEFINSSHVSDYYKELVKNKLSSKEQSEIIVNAINSERSFSEFTSEEFSAIYEALKTVRTIDGERDYTYTEIIALAFNLDSEGATDFLNNKVSPLVVVKRIVSTSGVCSSPEYYSGRGAKSCDLNGKNLIEIYKKLAKLDIEKAMAMAKMTMNMKTLGATEFLRSLYNLASDDYKLEDNEVIENNVYLGSGTLKQMCVVGVASIASSMHRYDETPSIKSEFFHLLPPEVRDELQKSTVEKAQQKTLK